MASFFVDLNRDAAYFAVQFDYFIVGYSDPESFEYFNATTWTALVTDLDTQFSGGTFGDGTEFGTGAVDLGLSSDPGVAHYRISFTAQNSFSGVTDAVAFDVLSAALDSAGHVLVGGDGIDVLIGGYGGDVLRGNSGNDLLDAGDGTDILEGGDGADQLRGGAGDDIMAGGAGADDYEVDAAGDTVIEQADGGTDRVVAWLDVTLADNVESLLLAGVGDLGGSGNALGNDIRGNAGANRIAGLTGNDTLTGEVGNDTLLGGFGADLMIGGLGADEMRGGAGHDSYVVDSVDDRVVELLGQGADSVVIQGLSYYRLGANIENLSVASLRAYVLPIDVKAIGNGLANSMVGAEGADTLMGGAGSDDLHGQDGDDRLIGGAGADLIRGGAGIDTADYGASAAAVVVSLATSRGVGGDADHDDIRGVENLVGSAYGDTFIGTVLGNHFSGGAGDDTLAGAGGNDTLKGGGGADVMVGGGDQDVVSYAGSAGGVTVNLAESTVAGGDAEGDTISAIEGVVGSDGDDRLAGSDAANYLSGGAGRDTIFGGAGNDVIQGGGDGDTMDGGDGLDTLSYAGSLGAVYIELDNPSGIPGDVHLVVGGDAFDDSVVGFEHVVGGAGDDRILGSRGDNFLAGGAGRDVINGYDGNDSIRGGAAADSLNGGAGQDTVSYLSSSVGVFVDLEQQIVAGGDAAGDLISGFEHAVGSAGHDQLYGSSDANRLSGDDGYDLLRGGLGNDTLWGGRGGDTFVFATGDGRDVIRDFGSTELLSLWLGPTFDSLEDVMAVASAVGPHGADTLLRFSDSDQILLVGVDRATLTADNFVFG